ncbi:NAD(P)/FAD-dependent oxidoreductase [Novosphingobium sp.]|uniref:NAD(P)/FAD-dependent oxidoreductase n=1 Tax=Novosphingobium sp. TaxID=1874826 RepID=UPI0025E46F32|nr:NAD(P)/FAD-dependent oxidoreductase [Novosphingobium sp.]
MVLSAGPARPKVVVIGAGFGGLAAVRGLAGASVDLTVIDQRNHHVFQPLLYQVATAALSPADVASPIRSILCRQANARVVLDRVVAIDRSRRTVALDGGRSLPYDWLVVATGAQHSYFGRDEWAGHAPGLKTIEDATAVRSRILLALERAETEEDKARRVALLTFVVIGGGPTGVELAGAIAELAHRSVSRDFRSITPHCSRIILLNLAPRLLESFPEELSAAALRDLENLGVEVRLSTPVEAIGNDWVIAGGRTIPAHTVIWAAGVAASPAASWLGVQADQAGRVMVDAHLHPDNDPYVFVIGDTAHCKGADGRPLPGIAPVAKRQGRHAAQAIRQLLNGGSEPAFRYRHFGNLATIGRSHAVIDFGWWKVRGFVAWLLWSTAHVFFLVDFRSRLQVGMKLAWNYLTYARHARLITGDVRANQAPGLAAPFQGESHVSATR